MAFEEREGQGALFPVDSERRRENGPTVTGSVTIAGKRYRLAGWRKEGKNGRPPWLSLKAEAWEDRPQRFRREEDESPF